MSMGTFINRYDCDHQIQVDFSNRKITSVTVTAITIIKNTEISRLHNATGGRKKNPSDRRSDSGSILTTATVQSFLQIKLSIKYFLAKPKNYLQLIVIIARYDVGVIITRPRMYRLQHKKLVYKYICFYESNKLRLFPINMIT